ncbi:4-amino-4-deoxychorismate lyase [Methylophilaceae bacterium]|nr:4-amino-4-deoxychorismate lyase [Methylophilaceae bacterium]
MTLLQSTTSQYLINGSSEAGLSPWDRGFAYGDGVFRTLKIVNGKPQHWQLHYNKLEHDCNSLGIVCPGANLFLADIDRLFAQEQLAVAKLIVTRGEGTRGYALPVLAQPSRIVIKADFPDYPAANCTFGVRLHLCHLRLARQPLLAGIKHLNRLENVLARSEWSDNSIAEGLLLDEAGNVIACTMSNVFARFGTKLMTPDLSQCGVAGVTRQFILDIAPTLGMIAEVGNIGLEQLMQADEVLICNSLYGVWQVLELNQHAWKPQETARELRKLLQE